MLAPERMSSNPFVCFVGLKPFRFIDHSRGLWDVGLGVALALGEMDADWVNPYRSDQVTPGALGLVPYPHGQRRSPNSGGRQQVCHLPGGRRPPGPVYVGRQGIGDDVRGG